MIRLAIVWHHHQPCYLDLRRGEAVMPWVRLHGTKDYYGMAAILREFPGVRAHFNLVPGLLRQVDAAVKGAADPWLRLARVPAAELRPEEKQTLCETFFMAHEDNLIRANARYGELFRRARHPAGGGRWRPEALAAADYRDLQVWQNLAWFHPLLRESHPTVRTLVDQGRHFSEADKEACLAAQREVLADLVPRHRAMQDAGQAELTTTPYWHPILPLLCRMESARVAMPAVALPKAPALDMTDDARAQLRRAVVAHRAAFGRDPRGLWPSEGSVSPEILPVLSEAGIRWFATDEGVLESSLGSDFRRGAAGAPQNADLLYGSWRVAEGLSAVFRDHALSDLVGFEYKRADAEEAAEDLMDRIRAGGRAAGDGALVTIALDGENAWEHYPGNGVPFLRAFYRRLQEDGEIRTVLLGDELAERPPTRALDRLWSGSWIHRNFAIWVGHPEDNAAWELLGKTRQTLLEATSAAGQDPRGAPAPPARGAGEAAVPDLPLAWDSLLAAEGSDWFWWFGDDHFTPLAGTFDALFRAHLQNVHAFLGRPAPPELLRPIKGRAAPAPAWSAPWALLDVKVDGRRSDYYEWISAGHYSAAKDLDVMDRSTGWIRDVWFGFDRRRLLLRVDCEGPARDGLLTRCVKVVFETPEGKSVSIGSDGQAEGLGATAAAGEILELAVPLRDLDVLPGEIVEFYVEAASGPASQRVPARMPIAIRVPADEDERVRWIV
ncbi:MAG: alpha-amylase/alpha-mannosidase [Planctomycetes bacterium]|nr:alpha-amylase/alpha-mannosidase [Planctomycetota bacterium]